MLFNDKDMSEEDIIVTIRKTRPLKNIDTAEIQKSLYEMLKDETIRFTRENKYKPRSRSPRGKELSTDDFLKAIASGLSPNINTENITIVRTKLSRYDTVVIKLAVIGMGFNQSWLKI